MVIPDSSIPVQNRHVIIEAKAHNYDYELKQSVVDLSHERILLSGLFFKKKKEI